MQEASTVGEVARSMPKFNATLDDHKTNFQPTMIECEGVIAKQLVSVLFDLGASLSYVSPKMVEKCQLSSIKFSKPWLVQLATRTKIRVNAKTQCCPITISGKPTFVDLNILPLGSYDILVRMDQLEKCWSLVDCKWKTVSFISESGQRKELQGIKTNTKLHAITANQLGKCNKKHCQIYVVQVGFTNTKNKMTCLENIPVIQEFVDVFPEPIPGLPPKHDIDFTIELIPGAAPISKASYHMSKPELTEIKMELQQLLDKRYICPSVSLGSSYIICMEKGWVPEIMDQLSTV